MARIAILGAGNGGCAASADLTSSPALLLTSPAGGVRRRERAGLLAAAWTTELEVA
jgi:hypothetical protein